MNKLGIYKFYWDCGRQGDIEGIFVAYDGEVKDAIGENAHFGEVLGKHSEIYGIIEPNDIFLLTDDEAIVDIFEDHGFRSGYNPLDYIGD